MNVSFGKLLLSSLGLAAVAFSVGALAAALPAKAGTRAKAQRTVTAHGETTSFHFDNIPVRSALQLIAEEGGFNLVVSDAVQGNISLRLNDVTWEQALEILLRMKGLSQRVDGTTRSVGAAS